MRLRPILQALRARLFAAFAVFLTQPVDSRTAPDPLPLLGVLRHGDVLLTEGKTRAAALVKRLTKSTWSHVSMYVGPLEDGPDPRCVVEADIAAGVRSIRLSELDALDIRILRPTGLNDTDRGRLAEWVVTRIGGEYDLHQAWMLARTFLPGLRSVGSPPAPDGGAERAGRFICSTLLADGFARVGYPIPPVRAAANPRHLVPSDFERASGFEVVAPELIPAAAVR